MVEGRQVKAGERRVETVALQDELLPDLEVASLGRGRVAELAGEARLEPGDAKTGVGVRLLGVGVGVPIEDVPRGRRPAGVGQVEGVVDPGGEVEVPSDN